MDAMRAWVLILMMVLLPLRGWAGSAMAIDHGPAPATHAAAVSLLPVAPCHGKVEMGDVVHSAHSTHSAHAKHAAQADLTGTEQGGAATCGLCDVCHSPLLAPVAVVSPLPHPTPVVHAGTLEHFASASARLQLKPPRT